MSYDTTTTPAVGNATKRSDYTRLRDSIIAIAARPHELGGDLRAFMADTSAVDLDNGREVEIDGTNLSGLSVYLEVNAMTKGAGAVTVTIDLYNVTTAAVVSSSAVAIAIGTSQAYVRKHSKSSALTLASGVNRYKARIKGSVGAGSEVSGVAWVSIRG